MSQLLLLGTNYVNFLGMNAWVGLGGGFEAPFIATVPGTDTYTDQLW